MCKFKSAIVLRNGDVLHNEFVDSHEDLVTLNKLNDSKVGSFVRVEYVPKGDMWELDKYTLSVDEKETPEWFENVRTNVEEKLKAIVSRMIISEDTPLVVRRRIIVKSGVKIWSLQHTVIDILVNSQVNSMWGNSQVNVMGGNSQVNEMLENSKSPRKPIS